MSPNVTVTVDTDGTIVVRLNDRLGDEYIVMTKEEARGLASDLQEAAVHSGLMR